MNQNSQSQKHHGRSYKSRKQHPSLSYMDEPILCQFLFQKEKENHAQLQCKEPLEIDDDPASIVLPAEEETMVTQQIQDLKADELDISVNVNAGKDSSGEQTRMDETGSKTKESNNNTVQQKLDPEQLKADYQAYNKDTCLKYVRSFFNKHLDDAWFRERYSPLEYKRKVQSHRERAALEATAILNEVQTSLQDIRDKNRDDSATKNDSVIPSFVLNARLGGGVKPTSDARDVHSALKKRKYSSSSDTPHYDMIASSGLPKSHLFTFLQDNTALHIMDIPSNVNDEHILLALKEHANGDTSLLPTTIVSGEVVSGVCDAVRKSEEIINDLDMGMGMDTNLNTEMGQNGNDGEDSEGVCALALVPPKFSDSYQRSAWAIFPNSAAKEKILETIIGSYIDSDRGSHARDSRAIPKVIEMTVDCSDPYLRYDVDADGKGGEPAPPNAIVEGKGVVVGSESVVESNNADAHITQNAENARIPVRHVSVFVSSSSPLKSQSTTVLSAAVSSLGRIAGDMVAAIKICRTMDIAKDIPTETRLDAILGKLFPSLGAIDMHDHDGSGNRVSTEGTDNEDMLDVAIAYLRRVHLFTFYNGCFAVENVGSCLSPGNPTSVIHQRLKGADEILQKVREENADMYDDLPINDRNDTIKEKGISEGTGQAISNDPKDMLVMRLDDSIEKALDSLPSDLNAPSPFVVNESIDAVASEVESLEEKIRKEWTINHTAVDGDGRARCSFHFCRKLFKDEAFLKKHLIKKHGEHVHAELAKCHDVYMMNWWDGEVCRPVPPMLVDCGSKFGFEPMPVIGAVNPCVSDAEPKLWREEEERIRKEEEEDQRYREQKTSSFEASNHNEHYKKEEVQRVGNQEQFLDIDDMKDEKVELSFTNIESVQPKKKKRKKRKLL